MITLSHEVEFWYMRRLPFNVFRSSSLVTEHLAQHLAEGPSEAKLDASSGEDELLSVKRATEKFGVRSDPLRKRLERLRRKRGNDWIEVANPKRNAPRYLYRMSLILVAIGQLKSGQRPGK